MNFPEYKRINDQFEIAILIDNLDKNEITNAINTLLTDKAKYNNLVQNCAEAKLLYNWENESKKLIQFYKNIFEQ